MMIRFHKMHSNGNDFVIIDCLTEEHKLYKSQIIKMADRKRGIGFDQLLCILPPKKNSNNFHIKVWNADGSKADMCLNGLRCVASYIWDQELSRRNAPLCLEIKKQIINATKSNKGVLLECSLPKEIKLNKITVKTIKKHYNGQHSDPKVYDIGNMHLLIRVQPNPPIEMLYSRDWSNLIKGVRKIPGLSNVNISLTKVVVKGKNNEVYVRTFEKGAGETLSCGSAAACIGLEFNKAKIISKGGTIFTKKNDKMSLMGPTENSFTGVWERS